MGFGNSLEERGEECEYIMLSVARLHTTPSVVNCHS